MSAWFLLLVVIGGSGPPSVTTIDFKDKNSCELAAPLVTRLVLPHTRSTATCIQRF